MKKLLLFAGLSAATLSFVGCNKEADVAGLDGRKVQIILSDAQTRTVNDGMSTKWAEGDALNVFFAPAGTTEYSSNVKFEVTDVEANTATGTAELTADSYDWYALYPYTSYINSPVNTNGRTYIGSRSDYSQKQAAYDSKAHLAGGTNAACFPVYGLAKSVSASSTPNLSMKQAASVLAIKVKNESGEPLTISKASFTAPEFIVGNFYIDFAQEPITYTAYESQAAKVAEVEVTEPTALAVGATATLYVGIKPFTAKAGSNLVVKITADQGSVEKTLTLPADVEFKAGHIKTLNVGYAAGQETEASSLSDIIKMDSGAEIKTEEVLVVGKYARGVMLGQNGTYLLAYNTAGVDAAVGDIVTVEGKVSEYSGLKQIANPEVTVISSGNEVKLPAPTVLSSLDDYSSTAVELIQFTGTLAVSGNYYNVTVAGSTRVGSIQYPLDADAVKALDKKAITATGFFTGLTGSSKYVNMMSTSVEEADVNVFMVAKTAYEVQATDTSVEIEVTGNVDWTVTPGDGVTVSPTSGSGDGIVTVSFPENTDTENAKEYSVLIGTDASVENDEFEINITQAKADAAGITTATIVFSDFLTNQQEATTVSQDGVTITFDKGTGSTVPKYYQTGTGVRLYAGGTMTVEAGGKTIISIELAFGSGDGSNALSTDVPTYEEPLWTGESGSVTFTEAGANGHRRIVSVTVKYNDTDAPVVAATLESIAVSGQTTEYNVGDTFTFDGTVTATYSDASTKDVTSSATVTAPDLTSAGTKEVTVSYTEGDVTKTATYTITVKASTENDGSLEKPYTVAEAMAVTEALGEGKTSSEKYYVKGLVSTVPESVSSGRATYFISDDGASASQMKVYNGYYIGNASFESADQLQAGDEVIVYGKLQYYKPSSGDAELEISSSYIHELKRGGASQNAFSAKAASTTVSANASSVKVNVYGNVAWTASVTSPATVDVSSGSGQGVVTVSIPENTDTENDRTFTVTIGAAGFDNVVIQINQEKKDASGAVTFTGSSALGAGMTGTAGAQSCTIEGITIDISNGLANSDQIRIYKNATITITAPTGKKLQKVVFTCTASGTTNYGPGCFAEHDGYSFEDKVGTWEGSEDSLTLTASGGQVRATGIVVSCE